MTKRRVLVPAVCTAGLLWGGVFLVSGCDSGGSEATSAKPTTEQQAAIDKANKATAEAHQKDQHKKRH